MFNFFQNTTFFQYPPPIKSPLKKNYKIVIDTILTLHYIRNHRAEMVPPDNLEKEVYMTATPLEKLKDAFDGGDLSKHCEDIENALNYYDGEKDADDFIEWYRETYVQDASVIYYHTAIEYLKDNDPSLMESLSLAHDMGYTADKINSELLATLLLQQELEQELSDLHGDLVEYFEAINQ